MAGIPLKLFGIWSLPRFPESGGVDDDFAKIFEIALSDGGS